MIYPSKHKSRAFALLLCLLLFCLLLSGMAEEGQTHRVVRVAFPSQAGMSTVGASGDLNGYNYEYIQKLAEYAGWDVQFITYEGQTADESIMSAMQQVMTGEADLLGPILHSPQVADMFELAQNNYGLVYTTLCSLETSSITSMNYTKLSPLRVAVYEKAASRNQEVEEYLQSQGIEYEFVSCAATVDQLQALIDGRADVLSSITLSYFIGTRAVATFAPRPYYFVSTKGNTELIGELDQAIENVNNSLPHLQEQLQEQFFGDTSGGYILSDEAIAYLKELRTLRILCLPNYAPYISMDENGQPVGILSSLMNDFAKDNALTIEYTFSDSAQAVEEAWMTGQYDCLLGLPRTSAYCATHDMIKSDTLLQVSVGIVSRQTGAGDPSSSSIAVYKEQKDMVDATAYGEVLLASHPDDCIMAVQSGDVDYACVDRLSMDYVCTEADWQMHFNTLLGEHQEVCVIVSRNMDSAFLSILNKYIHNLPDSTVTTYLSEATRHEFTAGVMAFIKANPVSAAFILAFIAILVIGVIILVISVRVNRKRNLRLRAANAAMQQANAAKSEFLSRMSHDIRTPMNAILGFAELGKQDINAPELLAVDLERITSSGEFLLGLVNDVLDMTKIESNAMTLKKQPYPRDEFLRQLDTLVSPQCREKQIVFTLHTDKRLPECLFVDKLRFNQVFFNLLSNAVKFTQVHGHVSLDISVLEQKGNVATLRFMVRDDGIGMSEEFQKHMFDAFSQEQQHISGREGTGLGLSIVKSIVALMGGTISVESQLNMGSTFTVDLQCETCALPAPQAAPQQADDATARLKGKKVLLCEDHPINQQLARRLLEKVGIEVTCAVNGKEGLDTFAASGVYSFGAVLMDIRMPVMDGMEATRAIRALSRDDAKTVPIIAMTANAFDADVQKCFECGMTGHLAKPFQVEQLYKLLAEQIK